MAKRLKLLLVPVLAIVCLAALVCGVLLPTAAPAQAETKYEYVDTNATEFVETTTPVLLVHTYNGSTYAMGADDYGDNLKAYSVTVVDGKIKENVNNKMLWTIEKSFGYRRFKSVEYGKYIQSFSAAYSISLNTTSQNLYQDELTIRSGSTDGPAINYTGSAYKGSSSASVTFSVYKQQEATSATVTRYIKSALPANTGDVADGVFVTTLKNGNTYAWSMFSSQSDTRNKAKAVTLDGDYIATINPNNSISGPEDGSTPLSAVPTWMTWHITRTASGITIQSNSSYSSAKDRYVFFGNNASANNTSLSFNATEKVFTATASGDGFTLSSDVLNYAGSASVGTSYLCQSGTSEEFKGTNTAADASVFTFYKKVEEPVSGTAHTVTFANGNASATGTMDAVSAPKGEYTLPACAYTLTNYTFAGWKIGDTEDVKAAGEKITLTADVTLTAVWVYNRYTVTYKYTGQDDVVRDYPKTDNGLYTPSFENVFPNATVENNKIFVKWVDADNNEYIKGKNYTLTKNITVTAVFANSVHITFNANGGTLKSSYTNGDNAAANSEYSLPTAAERTDYTLKGYICSADEQFYTTGTKYQLGEQAVTFTAVWQYNGYTLIFKVEGQADQEVLVKEQWSGMNETTTYTIAVNNPTVEGKAFEGWYLNGDTTKLWKNGETLTTAQLNNLPNKQGEFVASLRQLQAYKVTLHYGSQSKELTYFEGTKNIQFNIALFNQHFTLGNNESVFKHWCYDQALEQRVPESYFEAGKDPFNKDLDLYANVDEKITVSFDFGIQDVAVRTSTLAKNPGVAVPFPHPQNELPEKEGCTLIGWSKKSDGSTIDYAAEANVYVQENCTLYAVWHSDIITITLKLSATESVTVEVNTKTVSTYALRGLINGLSDAEKALVNKAHKDIVWKDKSGNTVDIDTRINATENATYTANYSDHLYTITFDSNGGSAVAPITAKYGDAITAPKRPKKEGMTFVGWKDYLGNTFEFTTMPGEDITLTAGWTEGEDPNPDDPDVPDNPDDPTPSANVSEAIAAIDAFLAKTLVKEQLAAKAAADTAIAKLSESEKTEIASKLASYNAKVTALNATVANANADLASAEKVATSLVVTSLSLVAALAAVVVISKRRFF